MPTYEYRCQFCGQHVEAFQRMSEDPLVVCPHCGKEGLNRIVSGGAGVIYRGEGWYVTDYSKKSSGGKEQLSEVKPAELKTDTSVAGSSSETKASSSPAPPSIKEE
jgi:putative FmdB family regulatory protein